MDHDKPWLKSYPPGVPAEIDTGAYGSVVEMFDEAVKRFAAKPAFRNLGKTIDYAELDAQSARFAAWLQHEVES